MPARLTLGQVRTHLRAGVLCAKTDTNCVAEFGGHPVAKRDGREVWNNCQEAIPFAGNFCRSELAKALRADPSVPRESRCSKC